MSRLSDLARVTPSAGSMWKTCAGCAGLFPGGPEQTCCRACEHPPQRCEAAHPEDGSPCEGPVDAVRVVDQVRDELVGCVHHAAVVLASVEKARVYPGSVGGAAIETYQRAQLRRPFVFDSAGPAPMRTGGPVVAGKTCVACGGEVRWGGTVDPGWLHVDPADMRSGRLHAATPAGGGR